MSGIDAARAAAKDILGSYTNPEVLPEDARDQVEYQKIVARIITQIKNATGADTKTATQALVDAQNARREAV